MKNAPSFFRQGALLRAQRLRGEDEPEHRVRLGLLGVPHDGTGPGLQLPRRKLKLRPDAGITLGSETDSNFLVVNGKHVAIANGRIPEPASTVLDGGQERALGISHPDLALNAKRTLVGFEANSEVDFRPLLREESRSNNRLAPRLTREVPDVETDAVVVLLRDRGPEIGREFAVLVELVLRSDRERRLRDEIHRKENREKGEQQCGPAHRNTP